MEREKELLTKTTALRHIAAKLKETLRGEDDDATMMARLAKTESRLTELAISLEPDEVEEAYLNSAKRGSIVNNSNAEDDDDDDDDEEDDDDDDEEEEEEDD